MPSITLTKDEQILVMLLVETGAQHLPEPEQSLAWELLERIQSTNGEQ